jgi:hypothetical protein
MASQITHLVIADRLYQKYFSKFDKGRFFAGNIFPDIRYLNVISREATHPKISTVEEILKEEDSFQAGVLLHGLVDLVRERFMVARKMYDVCPIADLTHTSLKLYEDEYYFNRVTDWESICSMLDYKDTNYDIPAEKLELWYSALKKYIMAGPSQASREEVVVAIGFPENAAEKMNKEIVAIAAVPEVKVLLDEFYETLPERISSAGH